jgi:hypothetical protein
MAKVPDAQLFFAFSDAQLVAVVDNLNAEAVSDVWHRAREAAETGGGDPFTVLRELRKKPRTAEAEFLEEFCGRAIHSGLHHRVHVMSAPRGDIVEYLLCGELVPGQSDWNEVRGKHHLAAAGKDLRSWLAESFGASFSERSIATAVEAMDSIPADLAAIADACLRLSP